MAKQAVIVSTARTPIGKAFRGAFNLTHGADMLGHAIQHAIDRAGIEGGSVEDVITGCGLPEGSTGNNVARVGALRAGCPVTTSGTTINRYCSSGLQAVSVAAQRIIVDDVPVMVASGVESISRVQGTLNLNEYVNPWVQEHKPEIYRVWATLPRSLPRDTRLRVRRRTNMRCRRKIARRQQSPPVHWPRKSFPCT